MRVLIAAIAAFAMIPSATAAAPQGSATAREAGRFAQQLCDVKSRPLEDQYDLPDTNVPPKARELLPRFKGALRGFLLDLLNSRGMRNRGAAQIHARAVQELRAAGVTVGNAASRPSCDYGEVRTITLESVPDHPDLLAAVITLEIPCGTDSSLALFEKAKSGWQLVLVDEAKPYGEVSGGYDAFGYKVSPPRADRSWFVVTANTRPWCTSCWNSVHYRALRADSDSEKPHVLLNNASGAYRCEEETFKLTTRMDGFQVSSYAMQTLNDSMRIRTASYRVERSKVERVAPLASQPEDFLGEWASMPWTEAVRWTDPEQQSALERVHASLHARTNTPTMPFVQSCGSSKNRGHRWVIAVNLGPEAPTLHFVIHQADQTFLVQSAGAELPADCRGETRPPLSGSRKLP